MHTSVSAHVCPLWSMRFPVHIGWSVFGLVAAGFLAVWLVCAVLVAAGLGVGHLLVTATRALVATATTRRHTPSIERDATEEGPDPGSVRHVDAAPYSGDSGQLS